MFSGFNGSCNCNTTKSKSIYKKMTKQELTDKLFLLETQMNNFISSYYSDKAKNESSYYNELMNKIFDKSKNNDEVLKIVDEKFKEHIKEHHKGGVK